MLHIQQPKRFSFVRASFIAMAIASLLVLTYVGLLYLAPHLSFLRPSTPMDVSALSAPHPSENKLIIPTLHLSAPFNDQQSAIDHGIWWQHAGNGNPESGGHFVLAAREFALQSTPQKTVEKSYFFLLDKLKNDDPIIVDFNGKRYGYKVTEQTTKTVDQAGVDQSIEAPQLTLYAYKDDKKEPTTVVTATPMGEVTTVGE